MMNADYYIIETNSHWPYSYCKTLESATAHLGALMLNNPARFATAGLVDADAYLDARERSYTDQKPQQVSAETFDDMLNCLPPLDWTRDSGVERFSMSEFMNGIVTSQYGRYAAVGGDVYMHKYVKYGDRSTYLTPRDFQPGRYVKLLDKVTP